MRTRITPKITKLFTRATIIGVIVVALSFILPIVPCTKSPVIAEPIYKLGLCRLPNPFVEQIVGISTKYYGINPQPIAGLIVQFLAVFIIYVAIFLGIRKKAGKVLDLTKK